MQRNNEFKHLADSAFAKPIERKKDYLNNYQKLYETNNIIHDYPKEGKNKAEFEAQMHQLFDQLKKWGVSNNCEEKIIDKIDFCKNRFFNKEYTGNQTPEFFSIIKQNLEQLWFILNFDKELPVKKKQEAFQQLCQCMHVCAPGLYTHIEDTLNSLTTDVSLERWLADYRTHLIRQFADKYVEEHRIPDGDSIHVYNAFLVYALNADFAPLSQISKIADPFIAANTGIDENAVTQFFNHLFSTYAFKNIIHCVCTNFYAELAQYRKEFALEEKEGWFAYSRDFFKKVESLAQTLGIKPEDVNFFEYNQDGNLIRFDEKLFKIIFVKACKENNKLFKSLFWRKYDVTNKQHFITFDSQMYWCQDEKNRLVDYSEINVTKFLADLINQQSISELSSLKLFKTLIQTPTQLGEFLSHISDVPKLHAVINHYLTKKFLRKIINTPQAIFHLMEKIGQADRWKIKYLFGLFDIEKGNDYHFWKKIISKSTAEEFRKFIALGIFPQDFKHDLSLPYLVATMSDSAEKIKILIEYKMDINKVIVYEDDWEDMHETPAYVAAKSGNLLALQELIHQRADIAGCNDSDDIACHIIKNAKKNPSTAQGILTYLVESKATLDNRKFDFKYQDSIGRSLIFHAAACGDLEMMKFLEKNGADLKQVDEEGNTLVHAALQGGDHGNDILEFLAGKVDFNQENKKHERPVHILGRYFYRYEKRARQCIELQTLVNNKADLNVVSTFGTPLSQAISAENTEIIKTLCELKADVNGNALHFACQYAGKPNMVKLLVEYKADMYLEKQDGRTPARIAFNNGACSSIEALINCGYDINRQDSKGRTLLHYVVQGSERKEWNSERLDPADALRYLIKNKANLYLPDENGLTPLHLALLKSDDSSIIETLMDAKADFLKPNPAGITPIMMAANKNDWYLWSKVAMALNIKTEDQLWRCCEEYNIPLLHAAVHQNDFAAVKMLAECKSIDLNQQSKLGITAAQMAVVEGKVEMFKLLVQYGVDFNKPDASGKTLLTLAREENQTEIVRIIENASPKLIEYKRVNIQSKPVNSKDPITLLKNLKNVDEIKKICYEFKIPLIHAAVHLSNVEAVKILVENKAVDLNQKSNLGITPAQMAVIRGREEMVKLLLGYGVDFKQQDSMGKSPLSIAIEVNQFRIAALLLNLDPEQAYKNEYKELIVKKYKEFEHAEKVKHANELTQNPKQIIEETVKQIMEYEDSTVKPAPKTWKTGLTILGVFALKMLQERSAAYLPFRFFN